MTWKLPCLTALMLILLCPPPATAADIVFYDVDFNGVFVPPKGKSPGLVKASIHIGQASQLIRIIDLAAPAARFAEFSGDGDIRREGSRVIWEIPATGGSLSYQVSVDQRKGEAFDARLTRHWAILRLGDLFPPARVIAEETARSRSALLLQGPPGWSFETPYGPAAEGVDFANPTRRFDRPTGWMAAGKLGIRRDVIADRQVSVAAPVGQSVRRLDILTFMHWTLPDLVTVFPQMPERILVVSAEDDMWRGGLSGPSSLYLHADRPLVSENATSTLLHELVHIAAASAARGADDWIVEGLAEYYSLEVLRRTGGISAQRHARAFRQLKRWVKKDNGQLQSPSHGASTARAVLLFRDIQRELDAADAGSLDTITAEMLDAGSLTSEQLQSALREALGKPSARLERALRSAGESTP